MDVESHDRAHSQEWQEINRLRRDIKEIREQYRLLRHRVELLEHPNSNTATKAILTIGSNMPGTITVDTTNETVVVDFVDDKGDVAVAPSGATVVYSSDTPTVVTVATDATNPLQGDITVVAEGTANISAVLSNALEADGVTEIPDPAPVAVTVTAGAAVGADLVLSV
jgi:hypothetical protein